VFAVLIWKKVPGAIGKALDDKIKLIRDQLAEAEALRKEAEALKAEYEKKAKSVDKDRKALLERAKHEADEIVAKAKSMRSFDRAPHANGRRQDRRRRARRDRSAALHRRRSRQPRPPPSSSPSGTMRRRTRSWSIRRSRPSPTANRSPAKAGVQSKRRVWAPAFAGAQAITAGAGLPAG
jgi:hypothetical protein